MDVKITLFVELGGDILSYSLVSAKEVRPSLRDTKASLSTLILRLPYPLVATSNEVQTTEELGKV